MYKKIILKVVIVALTVVSATITLHYIRSDFRSQSEGCVKSDSVKTFDTIDIVVQLAEDGDGNIREALGAYYQNAEVNPFVEFSAGSAEAQILDNAEKFPERASRVESKQIEIPDFSRIYRITISANEAEEVLDQLKNSGIVEYAEEETLPVPTSLPNDYYYNTMRSSGSGYLDSWALRKIGLNPTDDGNVDSGWDVSTGSAEVVVGVYGTGIDYTHPDLRANVWVNPGEDLDNDGEVWDVDDLNGGDDDGNGKIDDLIGWSFSKNSGDVYDNGSAWGGHDTSVAGMIGAVGNNATGMAGVGWNIKLMALQYGGYSEVIRYATDNGADIINFSWTGGGVGLKSMVDYAHANGTIVIFSSANNGTDSINFTSSLSNHTWIVGATDPNDARYSWSNYGKRLDFVAPGGAVFDVIPSDIKGTGFFTSYPAVSLDRNSAGDLRLVYVDYENFAIRYGAESNGDWTFENIESGGLTGFYPSLALDNAGVPHVAYYDWEERVLKYASKSGGEWSVEVLTSGNDQGYFPSIKIGSDGYPRIAFLDRTAGELKLASRSPTEWNIEAVDTPGLNTSYSKVSLALEGAESTPHIAYYKLDSADLGYAKKDSEGWEITRVDTAGSIGVGASLALDNQGRPHIAYTDTEDYDIKYASFNGSWNTEAVYPDGYSGYLSSTMLLDGSGNPYILSHSFSPYRLILLKNVGGSWQSQVFGEDAQALGSHSSAFINSQGTIDFASTSRKRGIYVGNIGASFGAQKIADWGNAYSVMGGTSAAAPMAAGLAALLMSANPDWTVDQIYWAIASTCNDIYSEGHDKYSGWGRIDAKAALDITEPLVDEAPPIATISYPTDGSAVQIGDISINGTAQDDNFTHYQLYYKPKNSNWWTLIDGDERSQKSSEVLGTWRADYFNLSPGWYDLKLIVSDFYTETTEEITVYLGTSVNPTVSLSPLSPNPTNNPTPTFSGVAQSEVFAVATVEYQLNGIDGDWTSCVATDGIFDSGYESYECQVGAPSHGDGAHTIYVKARDNQGAETAPEDYAQQVFTIDTIAPQEESITINNGDEFTNNLSLSLELSAVDESTGVSQMIISENPGFSGAFWEAYAENKEYILSSGDGQRTLYAKFRDGANNESGVTSASIIVDANAPGLSVNSISSVFPATVTGTATDSFSAVIGVEYRINSGGWQAAEASDGAFDSQVEAFSFVVPQFSDGYYVLNIRTTDEYGNTTSEGSYFMYSFYVDDTAPIGSINILGGATYTFSNWVTLNLWATDNSSGVAWMVISENPWFIGSSWTGYSASRDWFFSGGDGQKTVYVKFADWAGNQSAMYSASIRVDSTAPALWMTSCNSWYGGGRITVGGIAYDAGSTISRVEFSLNGSRWATAGSTRGSFGSALEGFYISRRGLRQGTYSVRFRAVDQFGRYSNVVQCRFGVDTARPYSSIYRGQKYLRRSRNFYIRGLVKDSRSGVANVEYRIDKGRWTSAIPRDGSFNSGREQFLMYVGGLRKGWHRAYIVSYDNAGNRSKTYTYRFYMR